MEGDHPDVNRRLIALIPDIVGPADVAQAMAQGQDEQSASLYKVSQTVGNPRISCRISEWVVFSRTPA